MATKPLTKEAIALTEKKMNMTLDDIIKMSKTNTNKGRKPRFSSQSQKFSKIASQDKNAKVRRFLDSRSSLRQGALAQRRTNFQGTQFPLATEAARKAAVAPIRNRAFNRNRAVNINKPRVTQPLIQRKAANRGSSNVKLSQKQVKPATKRKRQTLDSLFANMKEQRMRSMSRQNNAARRNGGRQPVVPWARGRHFTS